MHGPVLSETVAQAFHVHQAVLISMVLGMDTFCSQCQTCQVLHKQVYYIGTSVGDSWRNNSFSCSMPSLV